MKRVRLELPRRLDPRAQWNRLLMESLLESGLFGAAYGEFPALPPSRRFARNFHFMRVDGLTVAVDTWDGPLPSAAGHGVLDHADLLLKIEYRPHPIWERVAARHDLLVSSWTMFGYEDFPPGYFRWRPGGDRHLYAFSGDPKPPKRPWIRHMEQRGAPTFGIQRPAEFLELTRRLKWGVILQGRTRPGCDGKNRREAAYTSVGLPLALNYRPHYPFPMRPGIDYVYLETPEDLDRLAEIDPAPFADASRGLWKRGFSPRGAAQTLLRLVERARSARARPRAG